MASPSADDQAEQSPRSVQVGLVLVAAAVGAVATLAVLFVVRDGDSVRRTEWDLLEPPSASTLSLRIWVGSSSCNELDRVDVTESDDELDVKALVAVDTDADACTSDLQFVDRVLALDEPLGGRRLVGCRPKDAVASSVTEENGDATSGACDDPLPAN